MARRLSFVPASRERLGYCRHITPVDTKTRVVVLQHPRERDKPIGTARMATLCLPHSELHQGVRWDAAALDRVLDDPTDPGRTPVLLYPGKGRHRRDARPADRGQSRLVVVDGTWWQARKLVRENPRLSALPRYAFTPPEPSQYRIRREPQETYVSTIEALVPCSVRSRGTPSGSAPCSCRFAR